MLCESDVAISESSVFIISSSRPARITNKERKF
jgi:hypothetical protein